MAHRGVWNVVKSVLKTASRALVFRKKSMQLEACNEANQKQKQKCKEDMRLMKPEFRANDPFYCKDEVAVDAAKRLKKYAGYSGDTKQEKSKKNPKQVEKLKSDIKTIGEDFKGKEPPYCIDKTAVEYVGYVKTQTNWKGEDITFHPNSSGRFEVIKVTRESNFNPTEEYRWADEYSGRHSISNYGSSGSRYDGSAVRQVKSERFNNNRFVSLSP
ncbi:hypothetical protein Pyn_07762 [Prunus yedoensis var. nudiflora]|uniref:Uncharacterized protein n=1 Tax=Prunus yedoensis var. nudiflora TaxID=2094558 RepID=A0A314ZVK7_PRUYE|nr:hypothetical protein Pyn_07762 [Prunus yedoensis var. nudiflora]